ncbi:HEAT repeat domain-containing protein [Nostoc sp. CENA67]|uniref:HEAT repeat domain-containing protein n=1 Tax=Amazonocrinis nigriterrae CENA67 TaxID=2794033 RepID=A0A8J7HYD0_9NOST|nr:HEAT repeat domain-containing protein [Amazonocrinis nigriterrae]MBH8564734.1 HEAT repeat domain-containing protein [Amazonocrinis nigriterrae CENA67]
MEWLVVWGVAQAVGFAFKPILEDLAKDAAKDWAKDLLKGIPNNILAALKKEDIDIAAGKAIKEFLQLMQQELEDADLEEAEVKQYIKPLKQFIGNKSVKEILGSPFQADCQVLDYQSLTTIWRELNLPILNNQFNWEQVGKRYLKKVKAIIRESDKLRSILDSENIEAIKDNLQQIADNTPVPRDFDLFKYQEAIRERYGSLKLDTLESRSRENPINLWQIFVPQHVRQVYQVLPELPKEYLRRLKASNQLDAEFEIERIQEESERYQRSYSQQQIRSVLDVIQEKRSKNYLVILGDPGAGKSTLLQYLALDWVDKTLANNDFSLPIPLLIELRTYMRDRQNGKCNNFLEFYHDSPGCFFHLNQHKLHEQLKAGNAIVLFDGLDEVFAGDDREEIVTCIHRFTNEYPNVQVIVTSRIIGYKPERFRDAEFRHLILQDLDKSQVQEFLDKWHDKTFTASEQEDKRIKRERLQRVIDESRAIAELAGNPLLLTIMAILNLKRELPRDRSELYKDASEVLLLNWDGGRNLISDEQLTSIDYKDKQAMLRQVAYKMQTSEKGLAGNIIHADDLETILFNYLQSISLTDARVKARRLREQLRIRNFMLCFMGADYYAFVHRTFLEFFCASEFVQRFGKRGTDKGLTLEELKTEVFGKHWQDETWHEVLRLIAGMIDAEFVGDILDYLMKQDGEAVKFVNLFLAAQCFSEVRNPLVIKSKADSLLKKVQDLIQYDLPYYYDSDEERDLIRGINTQAVATVAAIWKDHPQTKTILQHCATADEVWYVRGAGVQALASNFSQDPDTKIFLQHCATADEDEYVLGIAMQALASNFSQDPDTKIFLQHCATADKYEYVRRAAIQALACSFATDQDTKIFLQNRTAADEDENVRHAAIQALTSNFSTDNDTKTFLQNCAIADNSEYVQGVAIAALASNFPTDNDTKTFLQNLTNMDNSGYVRGAAIAALASNFPTNQDTKTFLQNLATVDNSDDVRYAAIEALARNYKDDPQTKTFLQTRALDDEDEDVRGAAIQVLASNYKDDPQTKTFLQTRALDNESEYVRRTAIEALASNCKDDPQTKIILQTRAQDDEGEYVRGAAIQALASNYKDDFQTKTILQSRALDDESEYVRGAAIQALAKYFKYQDELFEIYYNCAVNDPFQRRKSWENNPRCVAIEIIIKQFPQHPQTLPLLRDKAENDPDEQVREYAQKQLQQWGNS